MESNYLFERWKKIKFDDKIAENEEFKISTYGRIQKKNRISGKFNMYKTNILNGYERIDIKQKTGKRTGRYVHKLVAEAFILKDSEEQKFVIHLDYNKLNNKIYNLAWATKKEKEKHQFTNPAIGERRITNSKLDAGKVRIIKRLISDPNRKTRMKMIAKRFGISQMQLYRIKIGENWGHIKI